MDKQRLLQRYMEMFWLFMGHFHIFPPKREAGFVIKGRVQKKIVEFSTKVGGWGQQWTDSPSIFYFLGKKYEFNPLILPRIHF